MAAQTSVYVPQAWETINCPVCDSAKSKVYERFGSELQYTYVKCSNCGMIYQSPRPKYNQHFIDAAYASYYQYAENLQLNDLTEIRESSVGMFKREIEYIAQYDKKRTAVLDIGSGMGTFLYAAKPLYKEAVGLDVSQQMASFVEKHLGVKVYVQQFEEFTYPAKFSLIHMSHVIEHVPDPNKWLRKAKEMLDQDGILVINVPNKFSFGFRMQHLFYKLKLKKQFSKAWNDPSRTPDHLFEPTIRSMKFMLQKNNYQVLEYYTYSRKDPASNKSLLSRLTNRWMKIGSNLTFITRPRP
ncbi:MAG TPA: class I SAM-dependent methyltransferase [Chitinophagaceae bacterium]|nr:class I SAM-dependent methyltransferase [Chitinophagaceae bacterium]